jgi:hypothetical protein
MGKFANPVERTNGKQTSPTTFGTVFLQAEKTIPIRLVRDAFIVSMQQCAASLV